MKLKSEGGLIILTDLFGGTPNNLSLPYLKKGSIEVITGLNLPMLLHLVTHLEKLSFEKLCKSTKNMGIQGILVAGEFLN